MSHGTRALARSCPLCDSRLGLDLGALRFRTFDNLPIAGSVHMVVCEACGFAFYDTGDSQADFDRYYRQNAYYCSALTAGSGGAGPRDAARFEALFQRLVPHLPGPQPAIFDIGCARGGLLGVLARHGYSRLYGVDMLPECVEQVRDSLGVSAATGSALELPFPEVAADLLVYSHVVEHVIDLPALVAAARDKVSETGVIYVEVPDASRYGERSGNPYQDLYLEHVNHLDAATLAALFESAGFKRIDSGSFILEAAPAAEVPCIWAIFRQGEAERQRRHGGLERHLRDYLAWSGAHPTLERFAALARQQTPLFLWGISQYAMLMLGQTPLSDCNLRGLIDKDPSKRTRTLSGCPIEPPETLRRVGADHAVLVTAPGYEPAIADSLAEMDFKGMLFSASGELIQR